LLGVCTPGGLPRVAVQEKNRASVAVVMVQFDATTALGALCISAALAAESDAVKRQIAPTYLFICIRMTRQWINLSLRRSPDAIRALSFLKPMLRFRRRFPEEFSF
jgi:hypothetical protein